MPVTDQARNQLYNRLREALGDEDASTMMEVLPPAGWAEVARQRDLDELRRHLDSRFATKDDLREQTNRFIGWMFANNAVLIGAVTLIVTLSH